MLQKKITINSEVENVWKAITQPEEMKKWYFNISNFEAKEGEIYDFIISITDDDGEHDFRYLFKILEVIPNKKLSHTWEHPGHTAGLSTLTWELIPDNKSTKVILTHENMKDITDENSKYFSRDSYDTSWKDTLQKLKESLEG